MRFLQIANDKNLLITTASISLVLSAILFSSTWTRATAVSSSNPDSWKTALSVGKFYSNKPDQIFKIQYRALNGTVSKVDVPPAENRFIVSLNNSSNSGILEVSVPRDYPYTNSAMDTRGKNVVYFINGVQAPYTGTLIDNPKITDCFFNFSIPFNNTQTDLAFSWIFEATTASHKGDDISARCFGQTVVTNVPHRPDGTITPTSQMQAGIASEDVACPNGFQLLFNQKGSPHCVLPSGVALLNGRWSEHLS